MRALRRRSLRRWRDEEAGPLAPLRQSAASGTVTVQAPGPERAGAAQLSCTENESRRLPIVPVTDSQPEQRDWNFWRAGPPQASNFGEPAPLCDRAIVTRAAGRRLSPPSQLRVGLAELVSRAGWRRRGRIIIAEYQQPPRSRHNKSNRSNR